ncbi:MAG: hypothetical protein GKR87_12610 [Kiritimatiellae bacterium]|nr:hypothetical protein [Kiritimatiellia bacterium]
MPISPIKMFCYLLTAHLFLGTLSTFAAPVIFFGEDLTPGGSVPPGGNAETARNDFLSNLIGTSTEGFESFPSNALEHLTIKMPL